MITKREQENNLRNYALTGNLEGIRAILDQPCPGFDINSTDPMGRSALFIAFNQGFAVTNRDLIDLLLESGALIANGTMITPAQTPKLLTRHANVKNLEIIFQKLRSKLGYATSREFFVEIGSGDGYLKYLCSLSNDPVLESFKSRMIETERTAAIVAENLNCGKYVINLEITGLAQYFGHGSVSGVISLNVLDIFSVAELTKNMRSIAGVLKPGGIVVHIMSSAIHEHLFSELQARFPDRLLLPYYQAGHIGLRVVSRDHPVIGRFQIPPYHARYWCELFAQNPGKFVEIADNITESGADLGITEQLILLKNYSSEKIRTALQLAGFELLDHTELTAEVIVIKDEYHCRFPEVNYFYNVLGTLISDIDFSGSVKPGEVREKSTYLCMLGRLRSN